MIKLFVLHNNFLFKKMRCKKKSLIGSRVLSRIRFECSESESNLNFDFLGLVSNYV